MVCHHGILWSSIVTYVFIVVPGHELSCSYTKTKKTLLHFSLCFQNYLHPTVQDTEVITCNSHLINLLKMIRVEHADRI